MDELQAAREELARLERMTEGQRRLVARLSSDPTTSLKPASQDRTLAPRHDTGCFYYYYTDMCFKHPPVALPYDTRHRLYTDYTNAPLSEDERRFLHRY